MTTRTYHSPNGGMAVAWRQAGVRNVFVSMTGMSKPRKFPSFKQADIALRALGYKENSR